MFAQVGKNLGSLFHGPPLGVFTLAFFFPKVGGTGAFLGMIVAEIAIFAAYLFTGISFLWYNVIGCVMVGTGLLAGGGKPEQGEGARPIMHDRFFENVY